MRKFRFLTLTLALALLAGSALAQGNNPLIVVNEHGVGSITFPAGPINMPGVLAADPGPGGLPAALTYNLMGPPALTAGDLLIQEVIGATQILSDIVRFNPAGTGTPQYPASLVFYSDNLDGIDAIADTGFPQALYTNTFSLLEIGPEGSNGVFYTPDIGQPGFIPGFSVTYHIISDDAPEPATISLMGLAMVSLAAKRWRDRRHAR